MKLIVTVPALAVSVLVVNFNAPDGSAATASELLAALDELEDVAGALDAVGVLAGVLLASNSPACCCCCRCSSRRTRSDQAPGRPVRA